MTKAKTELLLVLQHFNWPSSIGENPTMSFSDVLSEVTSRGWKNDRSGQAFRVTPPQHVAQALGDNSGDHLGLVRTSRREQ